MFRCCYPEGNPLTRTARDHSPWWMRLAHYFRNVTIAAIVAAAFAVVFPGTLAVLTMGPLTIASATLGEIKLVHDYRLCSWCTLNPPSVITPRMDSQLRKWHRRYSRRRTMMAVTMLVGLATMVLIGIQSWRLLSFEMLMDRTTTTHARLLPWCPYCRRDDGDADPVPVPVPEPSGVVG